MTHIYQPEDSPLCGQCCVAMAAGVSLEKAISVIGSSTAGTSTAEVRDGLRALGIGCAERLRVVSRVRPILPRRAIIACHIPRNGNAHWMLTWDGEIYDPARMWPAMREWRITSYLEIYS